LGVINNGLVYALYDYDSDFIANDELKFKDGDQLIILRHGDENESEWYWARHENTKKEGYIPRNYLGLYPRIRPNSMSSTSY
jgi:apoptosis-stimulating of p53 protein 1